MGTWDPGLLFRRSPLAICAGTAFGPFLPLAPEARLVSCVTNGGLCEIIQDGQTGAEVARAIAVMDEGDPVAGEHSKSLAPRCAV